MKRGRREHEARVRRKGRGKKMGDNTYQGCKAYSWKLRVRWGKCMWALEHRSCFMESLMMVEGEGKSMRDYVCVEWKVIQCWV